MTEAEAVAWIEEQVGAGHGVYLNAEPYGRATLTWLVRWSAKPGSRRVCQANGADFLKAVEVLRVQVLHWTERDARRRKSPKVLATAGGSKTRD